MPDIAPTKEKEATDGLREYTVEELAVRAKMYGQLVGNTGDALLGDGVDDCELLDFVGGIASRACAWIWSVENNIVHDAGGGPAFRELFDRAGRPLELLVLAVYGAREDTLGEMSADLAALVTPPWTVCAFEARRLGAVMVEWAEEVSDG